MEMEEGMDSPSPESYSAGNDAECSLGKYGRGEAVLPDKHGRHRRLLGRSNPAVEWDTSRYGGPQRESSR